jgi:phage host-nuclease inhibitor protein Gam
MPRLTTTERAKVAAAARWAGKTDDERREATLAAREARGRVVAVKDQLAEFEARFAGELDTLRAEVADLRQRVAA